MPELSAKEFGATLDYKFRDWNLLDQALTHSSWVREAESRAGTIDDFASNAMGRKFESESKSESEREDVSESECDDETFLPATFQDNEKFEFLRRQRLPNAFDKQRIKPKPRG